MVRAVERFHELHPEVALEINVTGHPYSFVADRAAVPPKPQGHWSVVPVGSAAVYPAGTPCALRDAAACEAIAAAGARWRMGCQMAVAKNHPKAVRDTGLLAEARKSGSLVGWRKSVQEVIQVSGDAKLKAPRS